MGKSSILLNDISSLISFISLSRHILILLFIFNII